MPWTQPNPNCAPWIDFIEQPADYRYRYLREKYHGHIVGQTSPNTKKKDMCKFPKVKLHNYTGSAVVRVWLITTELLDKPRAHIHKLARKPPKGVLALEPHDFIASPQNNFEVTLDYLHIVHAVSNDENDVKIYCQKKAFIESGGYEAPSNIPLPSKEEKNEIKQIDKNQSVFYIQIFDEKTNVKIGDAVSRKIKNLHNAEFGALKIVNCSRTFGTCRGDDEVFIFVEKISKDVEVRFFQYDSSKKKIWETPAIYGPHNVHHQLGIVFRTPKFYQDLSKDTQVFFELHRKSDGSVSDPIAFTYKPHEDYKCHDVGKKRPHSPETVALQGDYIPEVVTSYGAKRLKDESMSPDSTTFHYSSGTHVINEVGHLDLNGSILLEPFETCIVNDDLKDFYPDHNQTSWITELSLSDLLSSDSSLAIDSVSSSTEDPNRGVKNSDEVKLNKKEGIENRHPDVSSEITEIVLDLRKSPKTTSKDNIKKSSHSEKMMLQSAICHKKPVTEVNDLLKIIKNINAVDYEGNSALHHAAATSVDYLEPLLDRKDVDKSIRNLWGDDVVLYATRSGNLMSLKLLLKKHFEPNVQNSRSGETPLHLALSDKNYSIVELLLKNGADPLIDNFSSQSAYEYSLDCGTELRQMLIIWMQKNMFKKGAIASSTTQDYDAVECDLVGKLNELAVSAS